jgi:prophage DNA circulation protein
MGSWRNEYADSLQKVLVNTVAGEIECVAASYDGIPFFIEETESSGGREIVTSPLPFSDMHVNEDVGKKVRSFTFSIYLVGLNCNVDREKLEEAFNKDGYFELSHPYYGKFNVRCAEYRFKYSSSVLEYVSGEVTFVPEEDQKKSARSVVDLRGAVVSKSDSIVDTAKSNFVEKFSILGKAKSVVDSVSSYVVGVMDEIEKVRASIRDVSEFIQTLSKIRENVQLIMKTPADFADRIQLLLTMTKETFSLEGGFNNYVNESLTVMSSEKDHSKMVGVAADELGSVVDRLVVMTSACMAARSVVDSTFVSTDEALEMQNAVVAAFSSAMQVVDSSEDYSNLSDLQASALKYLRDEMSRLADIVELPLSATRDVLSICYDCYGNLDKLDDIIERNAIGDPMMVTRSSLKVLSK